MKRLINSSAGILLCSILALAQVVNPPFGGGTGASNTQTKIITAVDFATNTSVANGLFYFLVGDDITGMNLTVISAQVITAGTTNTTNVQITRCHAAATGNACSGSNASMLNTVATIDSGENSTATAAAPPAIDPATAGVITGDILRVDCTQISTTPAKGLIVKLKFTLP